MLLLLTLQKHLTRRAGQHYGSLRNDLAVPPSTYRWLIQLHENQRGQIRLNGELPEPFPISNDVKQGCVLAAILFSIMLKQGTEDLDNDKGLYIRYRMDGSLFNLRRLQAYTNT